jgi:hypothetical protein
LAALFPRETEKAIHTLALENWRLYIHELIKIDDFLNHFHNVNLKYDENIKGFDPNEIFRGTYVVNRIQQFIYSYYSE